jgi:hypothetical protein
VPRVPFRWTRGTSEFSLGHYVRTLRVLFGQRSLLRAAGGATWHHLVTRGHHRRECRIFACPHSPMFCVGGIFPRTAVG